MGSYSLCGPNTRRETVDQPTTDSCWHEDKRYPEGSVIPIGGASLGCMLELWKPILTEKAPSEPGGERIHQTLGHLSSENHGLETRRSS
ncbi:DUF1496 domain-containing protein [Rhizobium tropici]|uniref:DUF1496 domain-containing protein n=1 Tax=Rhizobium tropici TaxID=398 RepID=A0A6P1CFA8_RHITR|nr:DUF1496 domain-containing protein [Rhizobium tropici]TGF00874.1 DUF1496 domain-containing protein [Rhizobium sp. SEMIA 4088]